MLPAEPMVVRLGSRRVLGLYSDLLVSRDRAGHCDEDARRDSVDQRIPDAQQLLDALD